MFAISPLPCGSDGVKRGPCGALDENKHRLVVGWGGVRGRTGALDGGSPMSHVHFKK